MSAIVLTSLEITGLHAAAARRGLVLSALDSGAVAWDQASAALLSMAERDRVPTGWPGALVIVTDRIAAALDAGAADAVSPHAPPDEIAARLSARIRVEARPLTLGPLRIDPVARRVTRDGRQVPLLPREYALLLHLAQAGGRCVSRAELLAAVWGLRFDPGTNLVAVHASRLRAKLDRGHAVAMLHTEKGRGYRLDPG